MKSMNLGTLGESVNKYKCYINCIYLTGRLERAEAIQNVSDSLTSVCAVRNIQYIQHLSLYVVLEQ